MHSHFLGGLSIRAFHVLAVMATFTPPQPLAKVSGVDILAASTRDDAVPGAAFAQRAALAAGGSKVDAADADILAASTRDEDVRLLLAARQHEGRPASSVDATADDKKAKPAKPAPKPAKDDAKDDPKPAKDDAKDDPCEKMNRMTCFKQTYEHPATSRRCEWTIVWDKQSGKRRAACLTKKFALPTTGTGFLPGGLDIEIGSSSLVADDDRLAIRGSASAAGSKAAVLRKFSIADADAVSILKAEEVTDALS